MLLALEVESNSRARRQHFSTSVKDAFLGRRLLDGAGGAKGTSRDADAGGKSGTLS